MASGLIPKSRRCYSDLLYLHKDKSFQSRGLQRTELLDEYCIEKSIRARRDTIGLPLVLAMPINPDRVTSGN